MIKTKKYFIFGAVFFGLYIVGLVLILTYVFPVRPRFASILCSIWDVVTLLPSTLFFSIWLISTFSGRFNKSIDNLSKLSIGNKTVIVCLTLSAVIIISLIVFVFQGQPAVDDEEAYLFQAKTYLTGRLVLPVPLAPNSISRTFMIINWCWTTRYLWGHPIILAIGMVVGSPYIITVLMALGSILLLYLVGCQTTSKKEATIAAILMGLSPFFLFVSATLLTGVSMLFLLLLFILGWFHLEKCPRVLLALGMGFCLGWAFTIRPLTAILFGVPFAVMAMCKTWYDPKNWLPPSLSLALGGGMVLLSVFAYNELVTGNPLTFPHFYYNPMERLGFGQRTNGLFTPFHALINLFKSLILVNSWLFGWPISLLPIGAVMSLRGIMTFGPTTNFTSTWSFDLSWKSSDTLWVAIIFSVCFGYFFYCWSLSILTMPIYYYELLIPLCLLSAKSLMVLHTFFSNTKLSQLRTFVPVFCGLSFIGSFLFFIPFKAVHMRETYKSYRAPIELACSSIKEKALVYVGIRKPSRAPMQSLPYPSPELDDKILFVFLKDDYTNKEANKVFADRTPYLLYYDKDTETYTMQKLPKSNPFDQINLRDNIRQEKISGKIVRP
ncbi:MAG: glycosyltransferase family 39 protein [Desulfomonilaceae bacterium]